MRQSTAQLADSSIRLAELAFPYTRVHIHRTRLPFIHLDNVLHFAKMDRDGRVDGYVVVYLPDEVTVFLLARGELINAVSFTPSGRRVVPMAPALRHIREERERGEVAFCDAPVQQLAWMFASCAAPAVPRLVDPREPRLVLAALKHEKFSGVLELIVGGEVNYLHFDNGVFVAGHFYNKPAEVSVEDYVVGLLERGNRGGQLAGAVFEHLSVVPEQAPPKMIETYRQLFWGIVQRADQETAGAAATEAIRLRDLVRSLHPALEAIGQPLDRDPVDIVATPQELTFGLAEWASQFLEQVEILAPGAAGDILRDVTREQRFVLQKAGFYERLPWSVHW